MSLRSRYSVVLVLAALLIEAWSLGHAAELTSKAPGAEENVRVNPCFFQHDGCPTSSAAGSLKVKPDKHDFGRVAVGQDSASLTFTATNESQSHAIDFSSIVASPPFKIQSDACSGSPLAARKSCRVEVVFHPTTVGPVMEKNGLTFTDSANGSPQTVNLAGKGHRKKPTPTPTATATSVPTPTQTPTPTVSGTPTATVTKTCTPHPSATANVAHLVLIAGGQASDGTPISSAEVFKPATNTFTLTTALGGSAMNVARYGHAAANIDSSAGAMVLVTGGFDAAGVANSTETFENSSNTFVSGPNMTDSRQGHTTTFLNGFLNGPADVLIAGGQDSGGTVLNSAELAVGTATGSMSSPRVNAATALLELEFAGTCPGKAVVTGGSNGVAPLQTAELFDPGGMTFTLTDAASLGGSQMNAARAFHTATLLHNSGALKVLVAGGEGTAGVSQVSAEVFDVSTNKFTLTTALGGTNMTVARQKHTATAFDETMVLITGGIDSSGNALATAEVFDLSTNTFTAVGSMSVGRFDHAAALLPNGKVLITGGEDGSGNTLNTAEIFDPVTNKFTLTTDPSLGGNNMNVARKLHTATAF